MNWSPKFEGASIVVIGHFNPAIFHPLWFETNDLIAPEEAQAIENVVVTGELASFTTPWCRIQALGERFSIETTDPAKTHELRDLVSNTFSLLEHCPIRAFGLNRFFHFQLPSQKAWNSMGHLLAPKDVWEGVIDTPGTRSVSIWGKPVVHEMCTSRLQVRFEPSGRVPDGVFFEVNRHYDVNLANIQEGGQPGAAKGSISAEGTRILLDTLPDGWKSFTEEAEKVVEHALEKSRNLIAE